MIKTTLTALLPAAFAQNSRCHAGASVKQPLELKTVSKYYRVDRRQIAFLRFILEAYDHLAVLSTEDPEKGRVVCHVTPGREETFEALMRDLKKDIMLEAMPPGEVP